MEEIFPDQPLPSDHKSLNELGVGSTKMCLSSNYGAEEDSQSTIEINALRRLKLSRANPKVNSLPIFPGLSMR